MQFAELLGRPRLLLSAAIVLQWLTTLAVGLRAEGLSLGAIELVNVALLGPLSLVLAYRIATSLGGIALGAWTLLLWLATPLLAHALALALYDATVRDHVLPLALGLTAEPGYPAGVALLASVALLAARGARNGAAAGLAAGAAVLLVPEALVFAAPVAFALLATSWHRELASFLAGATPALLVVAAWRQPAFGTLSFDQLQANSAGLREYFWSQRLLQWVPLAGAIAAGRRSLPLALLLGGWVAAWVATAATRVGAGFDDGELFRLLLPALPAYVLLASALPLLVPTLAARLGPLARPV